MLVLKVLSMKSFAICYLLPPCRNIRRFSFFRTRWKTCEITSLPLSKVESRSPRASSSSASWAWSSSRSAPSSRPSYSSAPASFESRSIYFTSAPISRSPGGLLLFWSPSRLRPRSHDPQIVQASDPLMVWSHPCPQDGAERAGTGSGRAVHQRQRGTGGGGLTVILCFSSGPATIGDSAVSVRHAIYRPTWRRNLCWVSASEAHYGTGLLYFVHALLDSWISTVFR
jgi:hypothetical protein